MSKTAFLFPGQGAQSVGMGRQAYESCSAARALFERAGELLGYDLATLCFEGPAEKLDSTVHSQPALYVCGLAGVEVLREKSPEVVEKCDFAAGLSLGEYTALSFAGVLDFDSGLQLVRQRGLAMQDASDATPSGMVSLIGLKVEQVQSLCDQVSQESGESIGIANHLCPGTIVVSGGAAACQRIEQAAVEAGAMKAVRLAVSGAFHTAYMDSAVPRLEAAIQDCELAPARLPVVLNVDAKPHQSPQEIGQLLVQQVISPVLWENSLQVLIESGCDQFYEVGPGRVLRGLLKRVNRKLPCTGVEV